MTGTIIRIVRDRGFGFIRDEEGRSRMFVSKDLAADWDFILPGSRVKFHPSRGPAGKGNELRAIKIEVINDAPVVKD
jgi:cold shock CspA family protein